LRVGCQEVGGMRDIVGDACQPRVEHVEQSTDSRNTGVSATSMT
jgi:hypothetical protein